MTHFSYIHDLIDTDTGKTYKQLNSEKQHNIPISSLVELENGVRLFVVEHHRDCDATPLYALAADKEQCKTSDESKRFWHSKVFHGYREDDLEVVQ